MSPHRVGRFEVSTRTEQVRTAVGAAGLIAIGEPVLSALARWGNPDLAHRAVKSWARAARRLLRLEAEVTGLELVDPDQQYVVASLHEGFADALLLSLLPLKLRYLARDELFDEWPHLGRFLRSAQQVRVETTADRDAARQLITEAGRTFERGESLAVFPQGSILGIEVAMTRGAFRLAKRFDRPLLPVVITGTHRVWEHPYSPTLRYGQRVSMQVLPAVPGSMAVASKDQISKEMKQAALAPGMAPVRRFDPNRDGYWDGYSYEIDPDFPEIADLVERHRAGRSTPEIRP
ncbi:MAG: lysophospholipid acyltransferase family protein [Actinobacteria bacterium]|nr:lysophospholipid acyltransferase family protein [Actinomycetota bacterium]